VIVNVDESREGFLLTQRDPLHLDHPNGDSQVSTERFDDVVAAVTLAVTTLTILLGFLFNL
jgi:hypothetical protein